MNANNQFQNKIINITTIATTTTTPSNGYGILTTHATEDDEARNILSYALPLGCLAVLFIATVAVAIRQRHRIFDKWISLKQMRNTNPKFLQNTGLRRDSEFESFSHEHVQSTLKKLDNPLYPERQYDLTTIT